MKAIAILFVSLSLFSNAQENLQLIDRIIGVVGDEIILYSDLKSSELEITKGESTLSRDKECANYENLMYQKLLLHHAKLDSVEVADAEVKAQVERRLDYFVNMFGSVEQFEQYYGKSASQMKDEYFDVIKDQLLVQKEQGEITKNIKVTPADVMSYYNRFPSDSLPLIGEQVQYSQIVIDPEVRESERQHIIQFLDSIRQDIVNGKTSMTLQAARWSEDPGSRYKGGCYPLQSRGVFVPPFEAAVYNTPEGDYSPVFESDFGYHFVKVVEKRGDYYEACHILMTPKVSEADMDKSRNKADSIYQAVRSGALTFKQAALRFSTDKDTRNQEGRVASGSRGFRFDVGELPAELNLVLQSLTDGAVSEPVLTTNPDGSQAYVMYRLDTRHPAHRANMQQDYEIFQAQTEAESKQKEVDNWVKKKLQWTYTLADENYRDCDFQFNWVKAGQ
jgi:peptidyl-prolyl cis-trans isomerase SurA